MRAGEECQVELSGPVFGGDTLGRPADGKVILVPGALPEERVRVRTNQRRRGYLRGQSLEVFRASPLRRLPRRRHFGDCGGCQYQHLDLREQLELKRRILPERLARIGGLTEAPVEVVVAAPGPWSHRNHP